ncbi:Apolipoprotein N-acyltransferase [Legionella massiliensis]|uniref:Apolipoprotein N-acyltransferase n=1 Tax=Legionella massiliensis TaxID=1034943 RepID=A0A078KZB2_9GAMM|nr:apolipoprotein N-acyltransferase [Legionella massiliensis]CDZ78367.1 Apolipoprotein N-acyltransferase [Legionella massiliensis]CEE14105.1 Apolipoprotein N-acyltransferase [Legionella massiliensis]
MTRTTTVDTLTLNSAKTLKYSYILRAFLSGLLLPLGFAPFHLPWATILGLALFYAQLQQGHKRHAFLNGLFLGLGYFGLGISWVFVSIHEYGHLNSFLSALITLFFLLYLSFFPALMSFIFRVISKRESKISSCLLFSALWILFEYLRSTFLSGFPWLQLGFGQFDAPNKYLLPIIGVYGVGFLTCLAATLLAYAVQSKVKRLYFIAAFGFLLFFPLVFKTVEWSKASTEPLSVGVIQANLSMRDKWDETLFWQLLERYKQDTEQLLGTSLIVMPESAIPLPPSYILDFLTDIDNRAKETGSAVMLGIPTPTTVDENYYYNALITLGQAKGSYQKQHLVPFGEYIPEPFQAISNLLDIPEANLKPGKINQPLVKVQQYTIATLICYELAYGDLLRRQLPKAQWIVSISDDGWFGHSLAMYQQLQMAQVRSLETARYQVVANNDGLSSIINSRGEITSTLPAFTAGILRAELFPATGMTPWVYWGNSPTLIFCALIVLIYTGYRIIKQKVSD